MRFVASMTVCPSQCSPVTAAETLVHGTAMATMSAAAAWTTVPADTPAPRAATTGARDSGPRLLAMTTPRPARSAVRARA